MVKVFLPLAMVLVVCVCVVSPVVHSLRAADEECASVLTGNVVTWLSRYHGYVASGTAAYYSNGTLETWDPAGNLVNAGNYTIKAGENGVCYEYETYSYPPGAGDTCNTYRFIPETKALVGCEVFGEHHSHSLECYETCDTVESWTNWYSSVSIGQV